MLTVSRRRRWASPVQLTLDGRANPDETGKIVHVVCPDASAAGRLTSVLRTGAGAARPVILVLCGIGI